jgi:Uma2 family endonuclease
MAESHPVKLTYDDYLSFPDDGKRHELIEGDHYVTPAPSTRHQNAAANLTGILRAHVRANALGLVLPAPFDVVLSDVDVVEPDLLFLSTARKHLLTEKNLQGAPDLAIEIVSEATRRSDEIVKRKLYEHFGVGEYWIVDPTLETVKIYRREDEAFGRPLELTREAGDTLSTPLLPGLVISLPEVFD